MFRRDFTNFVRASSSDEVREVVTNRTTLSGEEARQLYLEEVKNVKKSPANSLNVTRSSTRKRKRSIKSQEIAPVSDKDLFLTVQNNDVVTLRCILDSYPDKIHIIDDYGWSLLMIACQANAIDTAKVLLEKGIDISIRDKAGNSARNLVIKNKNYVLADVLLNHRHKSKNSYRSINNTKLDATVSRQEFMCEVCGKTYPDKDEHLSSTIHNISASKGKKIPASYAIPQTNRGFQIMLKVGWDKDSGLGRDGTGKIYPIKVTKKEDRKGFGHEKKKTVSTVEDYGKHKNRRKSMKDYHNDRNFEIHFRREFY